MLHAAAYDALGLDWIYDAHEVAEDGLAAFLARLGGDLPGDWCGLSLTMPLKRAAIPLCADLDEVATVTNAANTLTFSGGAVHGANTDVPGMVNALAAAGVTEVGTATVLGGGATAAAAVAALAQICTGPAEVFVRTPERAAELRPVAEHYGLELRVRAWGDAGRSGGALAAPLVIATTPKGTTDHLAAAVPAAPGVLFDVLYDPWPTPLAAAWTGAVLGGLDLLVHQAVLQVELMTRQNVDRPAVVTAMLAAGLAELGRR